MTRPLPPGRLVRVSMRDATFGIIVSPEGRVVWTSPIAWWLRGLEAPAALEQLRLRKATWEVMEEA